MLIRRCVAEDMPQLLEIWLQATLHAHDYLPAAVWWPRQEALRQRLQQSADIWVVARSSDEHEDLASIKGPIPLPTHTGVVGFMAIQEDELLALYLLPEHQNQGMGTLLLELGQQYHDYLFLNVCVPNGDAIRFYQQHGFRIVRECRDPLNACDEYRMEYRKPAP